MNANASPGGSAREPMDAPICVMCADILVGGDECFSIVYNSIPSLAHQCYSPTGSFSTHQSECVWRSFSREVRCEAEVSSESLQPLQ
jgi:hypothetical protein